VRHRFATEAESVKPQSPLKRMLHTVPSPGEFHPLDHARRGHRVTLAAGQCFASSQFDPSPISTTNGTRSLAAPSMQRRTI